MLICRLAYGSFNLEETGKLQAHLNELKRKHRELDEHLEREYQNQTITDEVYKLKTQKLWFKDEIYRIQRILESVNEST